ncbi:hypothetical protein OAO01_09495, partial [Oligoflexia bacterium]|nr:hypothetical protein [Oligoflexia bacterium]
ALLELGPHRMSDLLFEEPLHWSINDPSRVENVGDESATSRSALRKIWHQKNQDGRQKKQKRPHRLVEAWIGPLAPLLDAPRPFADKLDVLVDPKRDPGQECTCQPNPLPVPAAEIERCCRQAEDFKNNERHDQPVFKRPHVTLLSFVKNV